MSYLFQCSEKHDGTDKIRIVKIEMLDIIENISLKELHTFHLNCHASFFVKISTVDQLKEAILWAKEKSLPYLFLGEGSNVLFLNKFDGLIIKNEIKGIEPIHETEEQIEIKSFSGENWHSLVLWALSKNYGGFENLSYIPGTVGAAPMQNIGAYGVEVKDTITKVEAINLHTFELHTFSNEMCNFEYRESIFKNTHKGQYFILSVSFLLTKINHVLKTTYGNIQEYLSQDNIQNPSIQDISEAVIAIRKSKLPNPQEIGNAGSFFKNPVIDISHFSQIQKKYETIPSYPTEDATKVKVPAGWLIENAQWKGYRKGDAGVHQKQALVLVNYGNAQGNEIVELCLEIQKSILEKFEIKLHPEVNIINSI